LICSTILRGVQAPDNNLHGVYGLLHHPGYRTKFADNLKRELPRVPFAPNPPGPPSRSGKGGEEVSPRGTSSDISSSPLSASGRGAGGEGSSSPPCFGEGSGEGFWLFADAGRELAKLHLDYEKLDPWPLEFIENPNEPLSYRVEKMKLAKDKKSLVVNSSLTLRALPAECFEYRLGNRSALEWVIDQYQVKEDKRSGIRSDPNRADDPEYIVRLVGQVVRVSVETVRIVKELPDRFAEV
jgi:predicted helicase